MTIAPPGPGAAAAVPRAACRLRRMAAARRPVEMSGAAAAVPRAASQRPEIAAVRRRGGAPPRSSSASSSELSVTASLGSAARLSAEGT